MRRDPVRYYSLETARSGNEDVRAGQQKKFQTPREVENLLFFLFTLEHSIFPVLKPFDRFRWLLNNSPDAFQLFKMELNYLYDRRRTTIVNSFFFFFFHKIHGSMVTQ